MFVRTLEELVHKLISDQSVPQSRKNMTITACNYVLKSMNVGSLKEIPVNRIVTALNKLREYLNTTDLPKRTKTNYLSFYKRLIDYGISNNLLPNKIQKTMLVEWINISKSIKGVSPGEKGWRYAMRILAWYASDFDKRPQDINSHFIEKFILYLKNEYGIKDWRQIYNRIVRYWIILSKTKKVPAFEWPQLPSGTKSKYALPYHKWPEPTKNDFEDYKKWCTADFIPNRERKYRQRIVSVEQNISTVSRIFGYAVNIKGLSLDKINSDLLFNKEFIESFFDWYINIRLKRLTVTAERTIAMLLSMSRGYFNRSDAESWLVKLKQTIGHPIPVKNKKSLIITKNELISIPDGIKNRRLKEISNAEKRNSMPSERHTSSLHRDELALRILIYRPLRSKNLREMKLETNLKKIDGKWIMEFEAHEMKNNLPFSISFPNELVPLLEDYLDNYRNNICDDPNCPWVFPSPNGNHICDSTVQRIVTKNAKRYLNVHIYPHLMRDIAAYWYIKETGDYLTISKLLAHSNINTTIKLYSNFDSMDAAEKFDDYFKTKKK